MDKVKKSKLKGESKTPVFIGIIGGLLTVVCGFSSFITRSMSEALSSFSTFVADYETYVDNMSSYVAITILLGLCSVIISLFSRRNPALCGILLMINSVIILIFTFKHINRMGFICAILLFLAGITSGSQDMVDENNEKQEAVVIDFKNQKKL